MLDAHTALPGQVKRLYELKCGDGWLQYIGPDSPDPTDPGRKVSESELPDLPTYVKAGELTDLPAYRSRCPEPVEVA